VLRRRRGPRGAGVAQRGEAVARKTPEEKQAWHAAAKTARAEAAALRKAAAAANVAAAQKRGRGRPSSYTPELAEAICERIAAGELVSEACAEFGVTRLALVGWAEKYPDFGALYARAREAQADACFEFALKAGRIATPADAQSQRLRHDAEKWAAAKLRPRAYSDKHQHEVSGPDGAPIQTQAVTIDPSSLTAEQRAVLRTALTAMRPPSERGGA